MIYKNGNQDRELRYFKILFVLEYFENISTEWRMKSIQPQQENGYFTTVHYNLNNS